MAAADRKRKLKFRTETRRVLDIVINSLYSHPDVFLRELVSNASDALDRLRFLMLTDSSVEPEEELRVEVVPNEDAGTLTVRDNGIGMTPDEMSVDLGTIAGSGTRGFLARLEEADEETLPELIGQFGVGFYSSFMVADRVEVVSRRADAERGARWASTGHETFTLREEDAPVGTGVVLHLKEGMDEYLRGWRLRELVARYSDFISYPVYVRDGSESEDEPANSMKPIWERPEEETGDSEYEEFYRRLTYDREPPLSRLVLHAEGTTEFRALLFVPGSRSLEMLMPDYRTGVRLYVRKVLIKEEADELLPRYLRFVKGVVESDDLPLNISRESLQENRTVQFIRRALTGKVIAWFERLMEEEPETYRRLFEDYGDLLKEGVYSDEQNRERLADLVMVWTSGSLEERRGLRQVVEAMPEDRERIYYVTGADRHELAASPYLESAAGSGGEVVLFDSPVDEIMLQVLGEYRGKRLVSLMRELGEEDLTEVERAEKSHAEETYSGLLEYMRDRLEGKASDVRFSPRLEGSPCIVVTDRSDPGDMMRRMMRAMNQELPEARRILELNPAHPVTGLLSDLYERDRSGGRLEELVGLLFDLGLVMSGGRPLDPSGFGRKVAELMTEAAPGSRDD